MIQFTDTDILEEKDQLIPGTMFWEIYEGYTATGRGQVSKTWEVGAYLGKDQYSCKLLSDNTVLKLAAGYRESFHVNRIKRLMNE